MASSSASAAVLFLFAIDAGQLPIHAAEDEDNGSCCMQSILIISLAISSAALCSYQPDATHSLRKTPSAQAKGQELWCYSCDSMEDGELCTDLTGNNSNLFKKCKSDEYFCTVKRISYTITTENSTTAPRMWSLQRQCSSNCGKGCIVIGERTKLYACTSCCQQSLCNVGEGRAALPVVSVNSLLGSVLLVLCLWQHYHQNYQPDEIRIVS